MNILGTGLQGLVGSRIVELLSSSSYTFENISRTTGVDITNNDQVMHAIKKSTASIVLHLAAKADVDGSEAEKNLGEQSSAWQINVIGTQHVAKACEETGKKLIYISTDFVFDGEKQSYTEDDVPNPVNWYAKTKYEGEKIVSSLKTPWIIARIAYPYRANYPKNDFVRAIKDKFERKEPVVAIEDHLMTPTFIDDISYALHTLIDTGVSGIFHVCGSQYVSPYEASLLIAEIFGYSPSQIKKTTRKEFFAGRAPRPFRLALKNDKISELGVEMSNFVDGLERIKEQL